MGIGIQIGNSIGSGGTPTPPSSLLTGLVSWWTLNESSGNRADSVGSNTLIQTGSVTGGSAFGNLGTTSVWNGSNANYLSCNPLFSSGSWSVGGFIRFTSFATNNHWFGMGISGTQDNIDAFCRSNGQIRVWVDNANNIDLSATGLVTTATWYHVMFTYNSNTSTTTFYLNGTSVISTTPRTPTYTSNNTTTFGIDPFHGATTAINGQMVGWGAWSVALTGTQCTNLYNSGSGVTYPFTGVP